MTLDASLHGLDERAPSRISMERTVEIVAKPREGVVSQSDRAVEIVERLVDFA